MMRRILGLSVLGFSMAGSGAWGHHAMEFIEMESYSTARKGEKVFHLHYDYMVDDADNPRLDHWEITPGLAFGITDRLMFDIHTHFAKFGTDHVVEERREEFGSEGPSPFMEAVALGLQYRLTEIGPVNLALSGTWEIPFRRAKNLLGSDDPVWIGTLILNHDFGSHGSICANFTYEAEGSEYEWGWALGAKTPISPDPHGVSAGIELLGDFGGDRWSLLPGIYAPINEAVTMKMGIEIGREKDDEDVWANTLRANVTLMYLF